MRLLIGVLGLALALVMLAEFFVAFLLPRRVKRDPRLARAFVILAWRPWRSAASRLPRIAADTMLGIFGPLALLGMLAFWSLGLVAGFTGIYWADHSQLAGPGHTALGDDLFFSAGAFFSVSTPFTAVSSLARVAQVAEAACGFMVLFIAIGYLPALFQAFSRRETAVSQLDPRAGSPPTAGALLERSATRGGWADLDVYLAQWETWAAEVMETQLSYPILGYFRSQHVNQNWLAALTTVVDACAFSMAYAPAGETEAAELTFAIGRHALVDLASSYRIDVTRHDGDRLPAEELAELVTRIEGGGLDLEDGPAAQERLAGLRATYEPHAMGLAERLALPLPGWLPAADVKENWRHARSYDRGHRRLT